MWPPPARRRLPARWQLGLRVGVGGALVALLASRVDVAAAVEGIGRFEPQPVGAALIAGVAAPLLAAWAWKLLLDAHGLHVPLAAAERLYIISTFFASFTPGGLGGDALRTVRLQQWTGRGLEGGLSVVTSRILSVLVLLAIVLAASFGCSCGSAGPVSAALLVGGLGLMVLLLQLARVGTLPTRLQGMPALRVLGRARRASAGLKRQPALLAASAGLLAGYHVVGILPVYLLLRGLGAEISLAEALTFGLLVRFAGFLPVSISGLGVSEAGFVLLLAGQGVTPPVALAVAIVDRLIQLVLPALGGIGFVLGWREEWNRAPEPSSAA